MFTIDQFIDLKKRYYEFTYIHQDQLLNLFKNDFKRLKKSIETYKDLIDEINVQLAKDFNIFEVIGLDNREVTTHTPFLTELLDPNGSHGQGNLFLRNFLKKLNCINREEANDKNWKVIKESQYIDLRLVNYKLKLKKGIFIENKIYTEAHSGQLSRYFNLWKDRFNGQGAFVYLSIKGNEQIKYGFFDEDSEYDVINDPAWTRFSYKEDIYVWLESILDEIQAPKIKIIVEQYMKTIKKL